MQADRANKWQKFAAENSASYTPHPAVANDHIGDGQLHRQGDNFRPEPLPTPRAPVVFKDKYELQRHKNSIKLPTDVAPKTVFQNGQRVQVSGSNAAAGSSSSLNSVNRPPAAPVNRPAPTLTRPEGLPPPPKKIWLKGRWIDQSSTTATTRTTTEAPPASSNPIHPHPNGTDVITLVGAAQRQKEEKERLVREQAELAAAAKRKREAQVAAVCEREAQAAAVNAFIRKISPAIPKPATETKERPKKDGSFLIANARPSHQKALAKATATKSKAKVEAGFQSAAADTPDWANVVNSKPAPVDGRPPAGQVHTTSSNPSGQPSFWSDFAEPQFATTTATPNGQPRERFSFNLAKPTAAVSTRVAYPPGLKAANAPAPPKAAADHSTALRESSSELEDGEIDERPAKTAARSTPVTIASDSETTSVMELSKGLAQVKLDEDSGPDSSTRSEQAVTIETAIAHITAHTVKATLSNHATIAESMEVLSVQATTAAPLEKIAETYDSERHGVPEDEDDNEMAEWDSPPSTFSSRPAVADDHDHLPDLGHMSPLPGAYRTLSSAASASRGAQQIVNPTPADLGEHERTPQQSDLGSMSALTPPDSVTVSPRRTADPSLVAHSAPQPPSTGSGFWLDRNTAISAGALVAAPLRSTPQYSPSALPNPFEVDLFDAAPGGLQSTLGNTSEIAQSNAAPGGSQVAPPISGSATLPTAAPLINPPHPTMMGSMPSMLPFMPPAAATAAEGGVGGGDDLQRQALLAMMQQYGQMLVQYPAFFLQLQQMMQPQLQQTLPTSPVPQLQQPFATPFLNPAAATNPPVQNPFAFMAQAFQHLQQPFGLPTPTTRTNFDGTGSGTSSGTSNTNDQQH